jgi:hypothetical protein
MRDATISDSSAPHTAAPGSAHAAAKPPADAASSSTVAACAGAGAGAGAGVKKKTGKKKADRPTRSTSASRARSRTIESAAAAAAAPAPPQETTGRGRAGTTLDRSRSRSLKRPAKKDKAAATAVADAAVATPPKASESGASIASQAASLGVHSASRMVRRAAPLRLGARRARARAAPAASLHAAESLARQTRNTCIGLGAQRPAALPRPSVIHTHAQDLTSMERRRKEAADAELRVLTAEAAEWMKTLLGRAMLVRPAQSQRRVRPCCACRQHSMCAPNARCWAWRLPPDGRSLVGSQVACRQCCSDCHPMLWNVAPPLRRRQS